MREGWRQESRKVNREMRKSCLFLYLFHKSQSQKEEEEKEEEEEEEEVVEAPEMQLPSRVMAGLIMFT